jgi:hypothetical protein
MFKSFAMKNPKSLICVLALLFLFATAYSQRRARSALMPYNIDWTTGNQTEFDLSRFLEKPAGEAGFIQIRNGHFYTADGKRLRIWGVNLSGGACFPDKEDAPEVAAFFARYGINGVRFHFLDSRWGPDKSIFDYEDATTRRFNPEQLDRFDFFVAELKKQGIYTNINLNVGRGFKPADGVPESNHLGLAKAATLFNDRMIMLQKEYARQLLTHSNPYTGNRYIDEPAVIIVEIVNENSLVEAWFDDRITGKNYLNPHTWSDTPPYYAMELTKKYNDWLLENMSSDVIDSIAREAGRNQDGLIPRLERKEFKDASQLRFHTEATFIMDLERSFYSGMHHFLKSTLGLKAHVAGNSDHNHSKSGYALLSSLSKLDLVDAHVYWQHPSYIRDPQTGTNRIQFKYTPMVNEPAMSTVAQLSRSAVSGMPFTVSETNHPFPSEYSSEGIPILAAYALLQDWDGVFYYTLEHGNPKEWNDKAPNPFDIYADPNKMTNMAAAALMFHRVDVARADSIILRDYNHHEIIEGIRDNVGERPYYTPGFNAVLSLIYGTRIGGFFREHEGYQPFATPNPIVSQTGELTWYHDNQQGMVTINTPRTQGMVGFVKNSGKELPNLRVNITNEFSSIILSSMDMTPIAEADELFLAVTSKFELTNMRYNNDRTELAEWGVKPGLILPVSGVISLTGLENVISAELIAIGGDGNRIRSVSGKPDASGILNFEIGSPATPLYLIRILR